jgi:hypothetical protein
MMLTAGVGERMLPLTLGVPKPALTVLGRPLVVQILNRLGRAGVDQAVLNLHHHPDVLRDLLERNGGCVDAPAIRFSLEETILGTGGGLRRAAPMLRDDGPIVVINGDFLADIDLPAALAHHRASGLPATLVLTSARPGYSEIEIDAAGRVLSLAGQPATDADRVAGRRLFTGCPPTARAVSCATCFGRWPPRRGWAPGSTTGSGGSSARRSCTSRARCVCSDCRPNSSGGSPSTTPCVTSTAPSSRSAPVRGCDPEAR